MTPTEACATPIIDRIKRLIRDLEAGAILGYDGPQEYWTTRMGAEASAEVARLLSAALAVEAGADEEGEPAAIKCPHCNGLGAFPDTGLDCAECLGGGEVTTDD